jgi:hypothetical protein
MPEKASTNIFNRVEDANNPKDKTRQIEEYKNVFQESKPPGNVLEYCK